MLDFFRALLICTVVLLSTFSLLRICQLSRWC